MSRSASHALGIFPIIAGLFALTLVGAGCASPEDDLKKSPDVEDAKIVSFSADPMYIEGAGPTTLSWITERAATLVLIGNGEEIELGDASFADGSLEVFLEETTIFSLVATGSNGTPVSDQLTVEVSEEIPAPLIGSFTGPEAVGADELGVGKADLAWTEVSYAETVTLEAEGEEPIAIEASQLPDGGIQVSLSSDTTFHLVAVGPSGDATASHSVRLVPLPTIERFEADRSLIGIGESVKVSWVARDAVGVELWVDDEPITELDAELLEGSYSHSLLFPATITLRAYDELGRFTEASVEVEIGSPSIPSISGRSDSGNPDSAWLSEGVIIEWTSHGASHVIVTALGFEEPLCEFFDPVEGETLTCRWVPPVGHHVISVSAQNATGVESESWSFHVGDGPEIDTFMVSPPAINIGQTLTVTYKTLPDPDGVVGDLALRDSLGGTYLVQGQEGTIEIPWPDTVGTIEFVLEAKTDHPLSTPATAKALVTVHGLPEVTLTATPTHYDHEVEDVILSWNTEHVSKLVLYRLEGEELVEIFEVPEDALAEGSIHVDPLIDTSYRIIGNNPLGLVESDDVSVTVALPEIIDLKADVTAVKLGEPVKLSWITRMADEISFDFQNSEYVIGESTEPYIHAKALGGTKLPLHPTDCGTSPWTSSCVLLPFPEGFQFPFDGKLRDAVRVYNNGFVSFELDHMTQVTAGNNAFPQTSTYFYVHLAPFWDYWTWEIDHQVWAPGQELGDIHYLLQDDPEKGRSLVIQWNDAKVSSGWRVASINFELVLWERGGFEYRIGDLDPGLNPISQAIDAVNGKTVTIGYQTPSQSSYHNIHDQGRIAVFGELHNRTFTYLPIPTYPKNGSYDWHPLATDETVEATMTVRRGPHSVSRKVSVQILNRPELVLGEFPEDPQTLGSRVRLNWTSKYATALQVLDQDGAVVCTAADQFAVDQGYCEISEEVEGIYTYTVRATGEGGTIERSVPAIFYQPISIDRFETDRPAVEQGESFTLVWETSGAPLISLTANGDELLEPGSATASGSITIPSISETTTFVLRIGNTVGMFEEEEITVALWNVRIEVSANETLVRPGTPVAVNYSVTDLDGGPPPRLYGTFPMEEVEGAPPYDDISFYAFATPLTLSNTGTGYAEVEFPAGFEFPYFGQRYTKARVMADGYITFNMEVTSGTGSNRVLPDHTTTASYKNVHLAPFWDDLHQRTGSLWMASTSPGTLTIQWKGWSKVTGSTADITYDLNFQVILYEDGTFEYRYGKMDPPPPPNTNASCYPNTCVNDANGSSATIGYTAPGYDAGMTHHMGGMAQSALNVPYPGGLANRTLRYKPVTGGTGVLNVIPTRNETFLYCVEMEGDPACRSLDIEAPIGIDSFTIDSDSIQFGESTTIRWKTHGGTRLRILDTAGDAILDTQVLADVDEGFLSVTPTENANYQLELTAPGNTLTANVQTEVIRVRMTLTAPATSYPGTPITVSWDLTVADPNLHPVIVAPMEERTDLPFGALDLSAHPDAREVFGAGVASGITEVPFGEGFTFDYLGTTHSSVRISVEGYLSFDSSATSSTGTNQIMPNTSTTYRRIHLAPFWDDFHTRVSGRVYSMQWDPDTFVVQWSKMSLNSGSTDDNEYSLNFMVVLHRNGDFEFRYGEMRAPPTPATSTTACYPNTCEKEANGGAATIGYQDPSGSVGYMIHYAGAASPAATSQAVAGGLTNRSWKFTRTQAKTGSVQVAPWNTTEFNLCAIDPVSGDTFCPEAPALVEVPWGIESFNVGPLDPRRGDPVTITWDTVGFDELTLYRNGDRVFTHSGNEVPDTGSLIQNPTERSLYVLEGISLGRVVQAEQLVTIRTFEVSVTSPPGKHFPGDTVQVNWSINRLEPGTTISTSQMIELEAGAGQPGAYLDVSGLPGARRMTRTGSAGTGLYEVELPFAFPYFGNFYRELKAMVDGYITFDMATGSGAGANTMLPDTSTTGRRVHIAPFWDDMFERGPEEVWTHELDANTFIIQWKNVNRSNGSGSSSHYNMQFQVWLHADGTFDFRYGTMAPPPGADYSGCYPSSCELEANGSSATIGFQSVDASVARVLHFGGNGAGNTVPFPGGLQNRSFRVQSALSGTETITVGATQDVRICAYDTEFLDCASATVRAVADPDDLMVTELMLSPTGGQSEQWFEIRNVSPEPIDLNRMEIRNTRGTFPITSSLVVPPMGYAVFAASTVPGYTPDAVYGSALPFDAGLDKIEIFAGPSRIGFSAWDGDWTIPAGKTVYLDPVQHVQGRPAPSFEHWCEGSQLGTPGGTDPSCIQNDYYEVDVNGVGSLIDISAIGSRIRTFETPSRVEQLNIPDFSWTFFGEEVNTVWAASRGWLSFSEVDPAGGAVVPPSLGAFPRFATTLPRGPLISGFWENLTCTPSVHECSFTYYYGEIEGDMVLVAEWRNVRVGTASVGGLTFQIQLWEDGDVKVVFGDVYSLETPGSSNFLLYRGNTTWIGFENVPRDEPDAYVTALHRAPGVLQDRVIHFKRK